MCIGETDEVKGSSWGTEGTPEPLHYFTTTTNIESKYGRQGGGYSDGGYGVWIH